MKDVLNCLYMYFLCGTDKIIVRYIEGRKKIGLLIQSYFAFSKKNSKQIWLRKCNSFEEAEKADLEYYMQMQPAEKLDTLQMLRESYYAFNLKKGNNENRKRLRRSLKIIQQ